MDSTSLGIAAALGASFVWSIASVLFVQLGRAKMSALALNLVKCTLALALLWATLLILDGRAWPRGLTTSQLTALGASGLIGLTLGDTAYFLALSRLGARRTLLLATLSPPLTAIGAIFVLGEPVTWAMAAGMACVLADHLLRHRAQCG